MSLVIGIPREIAEGEKRVAIVPEVARKFKGLGVNICIEKGAGEGSHLIDEAFGDAEIAAGPEAVYSRSQVIMKLHPPTLDEIAYMTSGSMLVGMLRPFESPERAKLLCKKRITSFALELIPRISRAQSMDALTSQATVAGYISAIIAARNCPKFFPMLTFAAGTLRPARVLVIGAGVAGLQAIATCHRLGAIVEAYDVRRETKEQAESVGARFIDTGVSAGGQGGYARELTPEEKKIQNERLAKSISGADVLITTAALPGKRSPLIVTEEMVSGMKEGSIVVDMAAEGGGNVSGTRAGETVVVNGVTIFGPLNLPSLVPVHASEMYSKNLFSFLAPHIKQGELAIDWNDEIIQGCTFTVEGRINNDAVKKALGLQ